MPHDAMDRRSALRSGSTRMGRSPTQARRRSPHCRARFGAWRVYARATIATRLFGEEALAVHETLSLDRFAQPWVRCMLPFRMPRAIG